MKSISKEVYIVDVSNDNVKHMFDDIKLAEKYRDEQLLVGRCTSNIYTEFIPVAIEETELEQENKQLKEQLTEKNKEIGELKDYIYSYNNEINNRPQVCNEYIDATCKDILYKMKELKM